MKRILLLAALVVLPACGDDEPKTELSKAEASQLNGTSPSGEDLCDLRDWYGDGECDAFCPLPDVDCGATSACQSDADCVVGEICEAGTCGPAPLPACSTDADCPANELCVQGQCSSPQPGCSSDADCAADEICGPAGQCDPIEMPPPQCQVDADCAADETCVDGSCQSASPQCAADADCAANEVCVNGACQVAPQCTTDADCGADEICGPTGQCDPIEMVPPQCQADTDCSAREVCDSGACVPEFCGGLLGEVCPETHYCDYDESVGTACGIADGTGSCRLRPEVCNTGIQPVCGCDGMQYNNECEANAAGTDILNAGSCSN